MQPGRGPEGGASAGGVARRAEMKKPRLPVGAGRISGWAYCAAVTKPILPTPFFWAAASALATVS